MPATRTVPGSSEISDSAWRTWRAPKAATRSATASAATPKPTSSTRNNGISSSANAARSVSAARTVPPTTTSAAWLTVPLYVRTSPVTCEPAWRSAVPFTTTSDPAVARGQGRGAVDDDEAVDGAGDVGVATDDDEGLDVVAGRDVDVAIDREDEAARGGRGLGRERGRGRDAEQDRDGGKEDEEAVHGGNPLAPGSHDPGFTLAPSMWAGPGPGRSPGRRHEARPRTGARPSGQRASWGWG